MASSRNSDVNLVIRARTEGEKAIAGLGDILENLFDGARGGSDDIATLGKTIGALDKAAASIAGSMDKAGAAIDRQRASITENNAAYAALLQQQAEAQRVLTKFGNQGDKAFIGPRTKEFTEQYAGVRAEVDRLGASISNLFAKIGQQNAQLNGTQSSLLKLSATSTAVADGQAAAAARIESTTQALRGQAAASERVSAGKGGLFGLKPYELTNLGYQLNDVATQLASGTGLAQTLGQQGGQILQIFPRITSGIVGAFTNPAFLGAAAVFGGIALAMKEAADQAERLRSFSSTLAFRADGGTYDAKALADQAKALDLLGAKSKDAEAAIKTFVSEGVNPQQIATFGRIALETSRVLGTDLAGAAKDVATAFTGGYAAIAAYDDKLNFLTAAQRDHIRELFNEGKAQEARTEALNAYIQRADDAAVKQRGSWAESANALARAWDGLIASIAKSETIKGAGSVLADLADAATHALDQLNGVRTFQDIQTEIKGVNAQLDVLYRDRARAGGTDTGTRGAQIVALTKRLLELEKERNAVASKNKGVTGDPQSADPNSPAAKQRADDLARISREDELQRLRDAGQSRILSAAEQARRAELAGQEAAKGASDAVVAAAEKRRAIAHETAQIEKETDARSKAAAADREREIKAYLNAVVAAEGTGKNKAGSSAVGAGQFTKGTFVNLYKQINPTTALGDDQIASLRNDTKVALEVLEMFTRQNAQLIQRAGKEVNGANLYLLHFLGAKTGLAALNAPANAPIDQVIRKSDPTNAAQIMSQNAAYLRTEKGKGPARTVGQLRAFLGAKVSDDPGSRAQTDLIANEANLLTEAKKKQDDFNLSVAHGAEDRQRTIDALKKEAGLHDTALLAEQRRQAVIAAEAELRQKAEDSNKSLKPGEPAVVVTQDQVDKAKELAGALFDVQHAQDLLNAQIAGPQRDVDANREKVDLLKQQAEYLRSIGDIKSAADVDRQIVEANGKIAESINVVITAYQNLGPALIAAGIVTEQQLQNLIVKLKQAKQSTQEWGKVAGIAGDQIAHAFASAAATAFTNFINKIAAGQNVFKAFGESIRELAANFIASIAQMIVQLLAFAAAVTILRALGVPVPNGVSIFDKVGQNHTGGIAGGSAGGVRRSVSPMLFRNAMRYHNGGIAGIMPDEVPAILRRGEEVLTEGDPRHRANGGGSGGGDGGRQSLRIVNSFDKDEIASLLLTTKAGEKAILNMVKANKRAFQAAFS